MDMGIKQIPLNKFIRWLESKGLQYIRTTASHDHYNYPERDPRRLTRNITVRTKDKRHTPISLPIITLRH